MLTRRRWIVMGCALPFSLDAPAFAAGLGSLRWRRREVVAFAAAGDDRLRRQRAEVETLARSGDDRDILWVEVAGGVVRPDGLGGAADLRRLYHVPPDRFTALLIGKDGGVKLRSGEPISARLLASTIDAMPMRRSEAAERNGRR